MLTHCLLKQPMFGVMVMGDDMTAGSITNRNPSIRDLGSGKVQSEELTNVHNLH